MEKVWRKYERTDRREGNCGPDVDMWDSSNLRRSNGGIVNVVFIRDCSDDRRIISTAVQRLVAALESRELTF